MAQLCDQTTCDPHHVAGRLWPATNGDLHGLPGAKERLRIGPAGAPAWLAMARGEEESMCDAHTTACPECVSSSSLTKVCSEMPPKSSLR
eukprot:7887072-Alexandrium_andersonii.AAC.3